MQRTPRLKPTGSFDDALENIKLNRVTKIYVGTTFSCTSSNLHSMPNQGMRSQAIHFRLRAAIEFWMVLVKCRQTVAEP